MALALVAAACSSGDDDDSSSATTAAKAEKIDYKAHRPVGRRPVRPGEAAAEDRADDRLRVAGALAEGPGDRARGVGEGVQRARRRQRLVHQGHHLRRRRQRRPGRRVRADDRQRRRRRDGERPGHRGPGRRVGRDGRRRRSRGSRRTSRRTTGAIRTPTRSTRPAPASPSCCRRRSSRRTSTKIGLIRVDLAAASALSASSSRLYKGDGDVPVRRPGSGRHHRLQPVHPRRAERRRRRRRRSRSASRRRSRSCKAGQQLEHRRC